MLLAALTFIDPTRWTARCEEAWYAGGMRLRRRRLFSLIANEGFQVLAQGGGLTPWAKPGYHGLRRIEDITYGPLPEHHLDVYLPPTPGPHPVVLYFHGGGFQALSRKTHWLMGLAFARRGFACFLPDYRLLPKHPYPAAPTDACLATRWVWDNAHRHEGDRSTFVLSGESAGGNLCLVTALAACTERPEPWAQLGVVRPTAVVPFCGLLQTSDPARFRGSVPFYMQDIIDFTCESYNPTPGLGLADPLVELERAEELVDWPRTFVPWGGSDPIGEDSARLARALGRLGAPVEGQEYGGMPHAFHAYLWRKAALRCWADVFAFLG